MTTLLSKVGLHGSLRVDGAADQFWRDICGKVYWGIEPRMLRQDVEVRLRLWKEIQFFERKG